MTVWFVTRHKGAKEWARRKGIQIDRMVEHLSIEEVAPGDVVIGSLPINLVADLCARGARYFHLTLPLPKELRGKELTADMMEALGAQLEEYYAERRPPKME